MKRARTLRKTPLRHLIQLVMVVIVIGGAALRNLSYDSSWVGLWPELQGFCPFGAVQTLIRGLLDVSYFTRAGYTNQWTLLGVLLITLVFGAVFCSTLCPLGSVQEWVGRLGRRLFKRRYNRPVPPAVDRILRTLPYVMLGAIVLSASALVAVEIDLFNPSYALVHVWSFAVPITAIVLLLVILVLSLAYERPWCRWFCPYGVILGALGKFSLYSIHREKDSCIDCKKCDRSCPLHIDVSKKEIVRDRSCNRCLRCVDSCPVPNTLGFAVKRIPIVAKFRNKLPVAVLILFFTPLFLANAVPRFFSIPEPQSMERASVSRFASDQVSPVMTLSTLSRESGIDESTLSDILGLPQGYDFSTKLMDIEEDDDFMHVTVGYIREIVDDYFSE